MNTGINLLIGILIGLTGAFLGSVLFIYFYTNYEIAEGFRILKSQNSLGKLIALGTLLNLIMFFIMLKLKNELIARGIVLATILLTVITLFV